MPALSAAGLPALAWRITRTFASSRSSTRSAVPSVDPSSTTMISTRVVAGGERPHGRLDGLLLVVGGHHDGDRARRRFAQRARPARQAPRPPHAPAVPQRDHHHEQRPQHHQPADEQQAPLQRGHDVARDGHRDQHDPPEREVHRTGREVGGRQPGPRAHGGEREAVGLHLAGSTGRAPPPSRCGHRPRRAAARRRLGRPRGRRCARSRRPRAAASPRCRRPRARSRSPARPAGRSRRTGGRRARRAPTSTAAAPGTTARRWPRPTRTASRSSRGRRGRSTPRPGRGG